MGSLWAKVVAFLHAVLMAIFGLSSSPEEGVGRDAIQIAEPVVKEVSNYVPVDAWKFRPLMIQYLSSEHQNKLSAYAAQLYQESKYDINAQSRYAGGIAQFTPSTAKWAGRSFCRDVVHGKFNIYDPYQAIPCSIRYMEWLYDREKEFLVKRGENPSDEFLWWAAGTSYNGGLGNLQKEQTRAKEIGLDPMNISHIEQITIYRNRWSKKENTEYMQKILWQWQPYFLKAAFGGEYIMRGKGTR